MRFLKQLVLLCMGVVLGALLAKFLPPVIETILLCFALPSLLIIALIARPYSKTESFISAILVVFGVYGGLLLAGGHLETGAEGWKKIFFEAHPIVTPLAEPLTLAINEQSKGGIRLDKILSLNFAPDGRKLAVGNLNGNIRLWQLSDQTLDLTLNAEAGMNRVNSVAFSPNGKMIAAGVHTNGVRIWQVSDGKLLHELREDFLGDLHVMSVAFSPDGQTLAAGVFNGTVQIWQVSNGTLHQKLDNIGIGSVFTVAFSPGGQFLAIGKEEGTVLLYDTSDWKLLRTIEANRGKVSSIAFSPTDEALAAGGTDGNVYLLNIGDGRVLRVFEGNNNWVYSLAFSPDGELLAVGKDNAKFYVWQVHTGRLQNEEYAVDRSVEIGEVYVAFSPTGRTLATGLGPGHVNLWSLP